MRNYEQEDTQRLQAHCHFCGVRSKSWEPRMVPVRGNSEVVGRLPEPAFRPDPPMHPSLTPCKESVCPPQRANKSPCYLLLLLRPIAQVPGKPCLNSFCGGITNFCLPYQFLLIDEFKDPKHSQLHSIISF